MGSFNPIYAVMAARAGLGFCRKVNKKTAINAAPTVLTDSGLLRTTAAGYRDVITCFYATLNTASDWVEFEIVTSSAADGSGTITALTPLFRVETGAAASGASPALTPLNPPLVIDNTAGGAWSVRAQTNDAAASFTIGINGWREGYP